MHLISYHPFICCAFTSANENCKIHYPSKSFWKSFSRKGGIKIHSHKNSAKESGGVFVCHVTTWVYDIITYNILNMVMMWSIFAHIMFFKFLLLLLQTHSPRRFCKGREFSCQYAWFIVSSKNKDVGIYSIFNAFVEDLVRFYPQHSILIAFVALYDTQSTGSTYIVKLISLFLSLLSNYINRL